MFGGQYSYLAMGISSRGTCSAWICYYFVRKFAVVMDGSERSDDLWSIMRETSLWGNKPCQVPGTDMKLLLYYYMLLATFIRVSSGIWSCL